MIDFKHDKDCFTWSLCSFAFCISCLVGILALGFSKKIYNFMGLPMDLIFFMFILLTFEESLSMWTVKQRFSFEYKAAAVVTIIIAVGSPISGICSILFLKRNPVYAQLFGTKLVFLAFYIGIFALLAYKAKGRVKLEYWKYAFKFNFPLIPHYLSLHILNHMDRIMIGAMVDKAHAGIYAVAYSGASIVKIFWQSINASLIPWTYEKCETKDYKSLNQIVKLLLLGFALLCVVFMFLAPEVMMILAPASYHKGIYVIPSVTAGVYFSSVYYIFANVVYYYKKPKYVMIGSVVSAGLNVLLNSLLIPKYGFIAAGYTTMVSYIIQALIDYYAMKKVVKEEIYETGFLVRTSFVVVFFAIFLSLIYQYTLLRLGLFLLCMVLICGWCLINKKVIMQVVRLFAKK